jgi:hypothetical protein
MGREAQADRAKREFAVKGIHFFFETNFFKNKQKNNVRFRSFCAVQSVQSVAERGATMGLV